MDKATKYALYIRHLLMLTDCLTQMLADSNEMVPEPVRTMMRVTLRAMDTQMDEVKRRIVADGVELPPLPNTGSRNKL